jgi:hypothetical protein
MTGSDESGDVLTFRSARRLPAAAATVAMLALALLATPAGPAEARQAEYTPPRSGSEFAGTTAQRQPLTLAIGRRRVQIAGFSFDCGSAVGSTSVQDVRIRRTSRGRYVFSVTAYGIVSFSDEQPDENARVTIRGQFSRSARSVSGRLRVDAPRCDTRSVAWSARRRPAS